ncbi:MAG: Holliday junction resolvase RuvX [Flavobacteriales bacterium]|jgi:putative Holliday junction resolvase|nr:Holliday junction resolvase RuvX [Flavobacteriales bacterium]MBQ1969073.1 Holliday junction resolvase RuvX [Flavobacteriales bacterium]MBQ5815501.1 Holliday junction resolvase RuvX [Flavobacteriales bacterium]
MAILIALDYGTRRVGIAESDPMQIIASPLCTLSPDETLALMEKKCHEEHVEAIVIGEPHHTHSIDEEVEVEKDIVAFIERLRAVVPHTVKIERYDERFTSMIASRALVAGGMKKSRRREKGVLDMTSATIILQDYMQHR